MLLVGVLSAQENWLGFWEGLCHESVEKGEGVVDG